MQEQIDPESVQLGQKADQVLQAATEPIDRPGHYHVKRAFGGVSAERIEAGSFVAALGAADAVILVDLDDLTARAGGDRAQLALLIGRRLIDSADAKVENGALHGPHSSR